MNGYRVTLAEDHRSRTCPGPLAVPTGFEVQPPHRRRRSSAPALLHGGRRIIGAFQTLTNTPATLFFRLPNGRDTVLLKYFLPVTGHKNYSFVASAS